MTILAHRSADAQGTNGTKDMAHRIDVTHSRYGPTDSAHVALATHVDYGRYDALISTVAMWDLLQETRIKVELPAKKIARTGGTVPMWLHETRAQLDHEETNAEKEILKAWKTHPLAPWVETVRGLGAHSAAVLVAYMGGDPYIAHPKAFIGGKKTGRWVDGETYVRTVSQLWSYVGLNPERRRFEGMSQDDFLALGKPKAKARCRLISEAMLKAENRDLYDHGRQKYAERIHDRACPQCHAKPGDPWRKGHQHAAALRLVAKDTVRRMWIEAERLHHKGLM